MILRSLAVLVLIVACAGFAQQQSGQETASPTTFGQRQVDQMLDDRPDMKGAIPASHPAVKWLIDGFDGKRCGQRICWNWNAPLSGRHAEHARPYRNHPAYISLAAGPEITPIDKWASVIFEMHNVENRIFDELVRQARDGTLGADEFAEKCVEQEFLVGQKTQTFLRENPLTETPQRRDKWHLWIMSDKGTFEEFKAANDGPGARIMNSNFEYFKELYEKSIVPYREKRKQKD
jgi:hypothetical protein